jgi:hypothetical protein
MRENINKVSQRGERLDSLQDKTDNLAVSAQGFRRGANRVRKAMWYKDMKMRVCLIVGIIILLLVIIIPSGMHLKIIENPLPHFNISKLTLCRSYCYSPLRHTITGGGECNRVMKKSGFGGLSTILDFVCIWQSGLLVSRMGTEFLIRS